MKWMILLIGLCLLGGCGEKEPPEELDEMASEQVEGSRTCEGCQKKR